jgi:hypothetical protein
LRLVRFIAAITLIWINWWFNLQINLLICN